MRATFESTLARLSMTSGEGGDAARVAAARGMAEGVHRAMRGRGPGPVARNSNVAGSSSTANASAAGDAAARVAEAARAAEPLLDMKQRTTHDDPEGFMGTFFKASRLHYIGTWKHRYEEFLEGIPAPPPLAPPPPGRERLILHVDMDCFFASVAALGRPELASLPVAVSWSSSGGGELSSCNYPARARGCRAGMRIASAKRLCPNLVVMPYEFDRYSAIAIDVYRILHDVSPHVMGVSVDEAYVDATADIRDPSAVAADVRARILAETGCVASVGSGPNRLIARLATKRAKPDGAYHVAQRDAAGFLAGLSAEDLPGVGRGAMEKLRRAGLGGAGAGTLTCADVAAAPLSLLRRALGPKSGAQLRDAARGVDDRAWEARPPRKSVGAQVTWGVRFQEASEAVAFVEKLAGEVSDRARRLRVRGRTLTLKLLRAVANAPERLMKGSVGHGVCDHLTRSATLSGATDAARTIAREATRLLADLDVPADQIRGVGVQISRLDSDPAAAARGAASAFRTAPAGKRSEFRQRARRYAGWFEDGDEGGDVGGDVGGGKVGDENGNRGGDKSGERREDGEKTSPGSGGRFNYAAAMGARAGTLEAALVRGGAGGASPPAKRGASPPAERGASPPAKCPRRSPSPPPDGRRSPRNLARETPREKEKARTTTAATVAGAAFAEAASAEATLRATYEDAARAHAFFDDVVDPSRFLRAVEAYLVDAASERLASEGEEEASALFAFARDLTRAQTCLPPFVTAVVGERGTTRARTFADAWLDACGRAEEDVTRVALTQ